MGDPAAGGADGPELPDLVVLEVGVAEIAQGRPLGPNVRAGGAVARGQLGCRSSRFFGSFFGSFSGRSRGRSRGRTGPPYWIVSPVV